MNNIEDKIKDKYFEEFDKSLFSRDLKNDAEWL